MSGAAESGRAGAGGGRLAGKRALVTGAGSGIGFAIAQMFAAEGASVVLHSGSAEKAQAAAEAIGSDVGWQAGPVEDAGSCQAAVAAAVERLGGLDVLVNNAAIDQFIRLGELDQADWRRVIDVNLNGLFLVTRQAMPHLLAGNGPSIVNVASAAALIGTPRMTAYSASKGAMVSLTRQIAIDYAREGLRANAICPGSIDTPMLRAGFEREPDPERARAERAAIHPMGRIGQPEDVAYAAVYLASDEAAFVTGACLAVDGGLTAA